jgi:hypothetical protein
VFQVGICGKALGPIHKESERQIESGALFIGKQVPELAALLRIAGVELETGRIFLPESPISEVDFDTTSPIELLRRYVHTDVSSVERNKGRTALDTLLLRCSMQEE